MTEQDYWQLLRIGGTQQLAALGVLVSLCSAVTGSDSWRILDLTLGNLALLH